MKSESPKYLSKGTSLAHSSIALRPSSNLYRIKKKLKSATVVDLQPLHRNRLTKKINGIIFLINRNKKFQFF